MYKREVRDYITKLGSKSSHLKSLAIDDKNTNKDKNRKQSQDYYKKYEFMIKLGKAIEKKEDKERGN